MRISSLVVRFLLLLGGFVLGVTYFGRMFLIWDIDGRPPWELSMPLFVQMAANALVATAMFILCCRDRGRQITTFELVLGICALGGSIVSVVASLKSSVWVDRWDWMSTSGIALVVMYGIWIALRSKIQQPIISPSIR